MIVYTESEVEAVSYTYIYVVVNAYSTDWSPFVSLFRVQREIQLRRTKRERTISRPSSLFLFLSLSLFSWNAEIEIDNRFEENRENRDVEKKIFRTGCKIKKNIYKLR